MEKTVHNCWLSSYTEVGGYPKVTPHPAEFVAPGVAYEECFGDISDHNTPEAVAGYIRDLLAGEDFWDAFFINEPEEPRCCGVLGHSHTCNHAEWRYGDTTATASKPCELHGESYCLTLSQREGHCEELSGPRESPREETICYKRVGQCEWGHCASDAVVWVNGRHVCSMHADCPECGHPTLGKPCENPACLANPELTEEARRIITERAERVEREEQERAMLRRAREQAFSYRKGDE